MARAIDLVGRHSGVALTYFDSKLVAYLAEINAELGIQMPVRDNPSGSHPVIRCMYESDPGSGRHRRGDVWDNAGNYLGNLLID